MLPYETYLTPISSGVAEDGTFLLSGNAELRAAAEDCRAAVILHVSFRTESGLPSRRRAASFLRSGEQQQNFLRSAVWNLRQGSFYALTVAFPALPTEYGEACVSFLRTPTKELNPPGWPVLASFAPQGDGGLFAGGADCLSVGEAVNAVLLPCGWHSPCGEPAAAAPLPAVRRSLDRAAAGIKRSKIFLTLPLFGCDRTLPHGEGAAGRRMISQAEAVALARARGAEIQYDEEAQSPYFTYSARSGKKHIVFFEDARSMRAKLALVQEYNLQGVNLWNLNRPFPSLWPLLDSCCRIETLL